MSYLSPQIAKLQSVNPKLKFTDTVNHTYKIGMDEIAGLREAIAEAMAPVVEHLNGKSYWGPHKLEPVEYKSRDGFIANSHNCGGFAIGMHVPQCEEREWSFLTFGELTEEYLRDEDPWENEGELDAYLRIWLKFEGIDADGNLQFYLNACGGNNDAPYFRVNNLPDLFDAEFTCKSVAGVKRAAAKHVKALLKVIA